MSLFGKKNNAEDCPAGDGCPVHHRLDAETSHDEIKYGSAIAYVGDYVVFSGDNPRKVDPLVRMIAKAMQMEGELGAEDEPQYQTSVLYVGPKGTLSDFLDTPGALSEATRFTQKHDEWDNFFSAHEMIRDAVAAGHLDLTQKTEL